MKKTIFKSIFFLLHAIWFTTTFSFQIELKDWEVNVDGTWRKTAPIYWEAPASMGGLEIEYNGYGRYRTHFQLSRKSGHKNLAFYSPCIDDTDMAFLNGRLIGETGKVPPINTLKPIGQMRSGVREARLYPIPETYLHDATHQPNDLEIVVYDLAGTGGFCFKQTPVIGDLEELDKLVISQRLYNDVPRWIVISLLVIIVVFCVILFFQSYRKYFALKKRQGVSKKTGSWQPRDLIPATRRIFKVNNNRINTAQALSETHDTINREKAFRILALTMTSLMVAIFLLSEIPSKYNFIESESFWYQFPPLAFYIAIFFSQSVFHVEAFGSGLENRRPVSRILYVSGHPYWYLPMIIFLLFSTPEYSWSFFVRAGLGYALIVHLALGLSVIIQLIKYIYQKNKRNASGRLFPLIKYQLYLRLLALIFISLGIFLFYTRGEFFNNSVLIMGSFYNLTLLISTYFFVQYEIRLPLSREEFRKDPSHEFEQELRTGYSLTKTEVLICRAIRLGTKRAGILELLGISDSALKNHLKSIYAKTIDRYQGQTSAGHDKLQRLTIFLMRIG